MKELYKIELGQAYRLKHYVDYAEYRVKQKLNGKQSHAIRWIIMSQYRKDNSIKTAMAGSTHSYYIATKEIVEGLEKKIKQIINDLRCDESQQTLSDIALDNYKVKSIQAFSDEQIAIISLISAKAKIGLDESILELARQRCDQIIESINWGG